MTRRLITVLILCSVGALVSEHTRGQNRVQISLVADQAEAVMHVLTKRKANQSIIEVDWQRIFRSEGYVRLKQRETSMGRSFEDADFRTFVLSDRLAERATSLVETLRRWKVADITRAAHLALAYLPKQALIRAKIYPVIKPRENSFVFDVKTTRLFFCTLIRQ